MARSYYAILRRGLIGLLIVLSSPTLLSHASEPRPLRATVGITSDFHSASASDDIAADPREATSWAEFRGIPYPTGASAGIPFRSGATDHLPSQIRSALLYPAVGLSSLQTRGHDGYGHASSIIPTEWSVHQVRHSDEEPDARRRGALRQSENDLRSESPRRGRGRADDDESRWLAFDKLQHFTVSFLWTLGTQYVFVNKIALSEGQALPVSIVSSATVGLAKEYYDLRIGHRHTFSYRDLAADAAGILLAVAVILL